MEFIIVSFKHSTKDKPCFWRANDAGYTTNPFMAGKYTKEQVQAQPDYYNDGIHTVAVPITGAAFDLIEFSCSLSWPMLDVQQVETTKLLAL